MARYLLDTNVLSEPLAKRPDPAVLSRLSSSWHECATAAPVIHELRFGAELLAPSRRRATIESYIETVVLPLYEVLTYDRSAAEWHATERARLTKLGKTPSIVDGIIAAIAKVNGLVLVTANVKHFLVFHDVDVESWKS